MLTFLIFNLYIGYDLSTKQGNNNRNRTAIFFINYHTNIILFPKEFVNLYCC